MEAIATLGNPVSVPVFLLLLYLAAIGWNSLNYEICHLLRKKVKRENSISPNENILTQDRRSL